MHLMVAAPEIGLQWGGIGTYLHQLIDGLGPQHEVTILGGGSAANPVGRARLVPIAHGRSIMSVYASFQLALPRRLPSLLRDYRPDLILVNHAQMPDLLVRSRHRGPPFVTIAHTTVRGQAAAIRRSRRDGGPMDSSERVTLAASAALLPAEIYYWHRVRNAVFVSEAVEREVLQVSTTHLRVRATVPNGIDQDELVHEQHEPVPEDEGGNEPVILYSSRMLGMKGLATLFRALRQLRPTGWSACLAGAGDLSGWRQFGRSLGLPEDRVRFLGPVPRSRVLRLLRGSALFVLPSYYESCPFSLMEAMALGVPCVASAIPGIQAMVAHGESALLVPPGDAGSLAGALQSLLDDRDRGRRLAASARAIARQKFTARRMREDTLRAFERVLAAE